MTRSRFKSDWILPVLALVALAVWAWQRLDFFETSRRNAPSLEHIFEERTHVRRALRPAERNHQHSIERHAERLD